jgi:hypothetical protein
LQVSSQNKFPFILNSSYIFTVSSHLFTYFIFSLAVSSFFLAGNIFSGRNQRKKLPKIKTKKVRRIHKMNDFSSTLVAHCGARKVTRDELMMSPTPEATKTHQPLAHYQIVEVLEEALSFRYLKVVKDEYAVSQDGMKMFGVMDLNYEFSGCRFSIGLRNSNDKSMRLALTAGYRVFVCDNMAFSGDFTPMLYKHTRNLDLKDSVSIAIDRIHRGFEPLKAKVEEMREMSLSDISAKLIIYRAFLDRSVKGIPRHLMPLVHELYFHPQQDAFIPRNLWSLSNAFTSAFKKLAPVKQFEITARLGSFLSGVQANFTKEKELFFHLQKDNQLIEIDDFRKKGEQLKTAGQENALRKDFSNENFDEDEVAEDSYEIEEFDEYFDEEAEVEAIDEAEEQLIEEYERRAAA